MKKLLPVFFFVIYGCSTINHEPLGSDNHELASELDRKGAGAICREYLQNSKSKGLFKKGSVRIYSVSEFDKEFKSSFKRFDDCWIAVFEETEPVYDAVEKYIVVINKKTSKVEYSAIGQYSFWKLVWTFQEQ